MVFVSFMELRFIFIGAHLLDNITRIKHCSNVVLEILSYTVQEFLLLKKSYRVAVK